MIDGLDSMCVIFEGEKRGELRVEKIDIELS